MKRIVIATVKSWNIEFAESFRERRKDCFHVEIITDPKDLTLSSLKRFSPEYIFFPHWSWKIDASIYNAYKCIGFHMTDLPYGRGGSPLQNLIVRKQYKTVISAMDIGKELDGGSIYMKIPFDISRGSAENILKRAGRLIFSRMIPAIALKDIHSQPQKGSPVVFKRRTLEESDLKQADITSPDDMYDFVRMLDGEGYPKAYIRIGGVCLRFSGVKRDENGVYGKFEVSNE